MVARGTITASGARNGAGRPPRKGDSATPTVPEIAEEVPGDKGEKKAKKDKDKNVKMIYEDELSPEERMAMMPKYAFTPA